MLGSRHRKHSNVGNEWRHRCVHFHTIMHSACVMHCPSHAWGLSDGYYVMF